MPQKMPASIEQELGVRTYDAAVVAQALEESGFKILVYVCVCYVCKWWCWWEYIYKNA
jgi:hypothetical protein